MALGTPVRGMAVLRSVETAAERTATASDAVENIAVLAADEEIWGADVGDMSFLSGRTGDGTKEKPYQITTKEHLIGLAALASMGMEVGSGEGTYPGNYKGAWFELGKNIDLGGMNWIPIGFYHTGADMRAGRVSPFEGHFSGNGKTVSNFRMYQPSWDFGGLFGAVENAEITELKVKPGHVITVKENGGILAGRAKHSVIRDVTVNGTLRTTGTAGGVIADVLEDSVVENCISDHVAIDTGSGKEIFAGGIAGRAAESLIADCEVNTFKGQFCLSGACYPETHQEADGFKKDLEALKKKVDAGAEYLVTQIFFDNDYYYRLVREARKIGITVPILAGIMPITNAKSLIRTTKMCGCTIPYQLSTMIEAHYDNPEAMKEIGINYAAQQIIDLITNGVDGIHIYTMNRAETAQRVFDSIPAVLKELN